MSLIEPLRFLLLNAVMIPMTKKTFCRCLNRSIPALVPTGDPSLSSSALAALAAASCTSNEEIVLSNALEFAQVAKSMLNAKVTAVITSCAM